MDTLSELPKNTFKMGVCQCPNCNHEQEQDLSTDGAIHETACENCHKPFLYEYSGSKTHAGYFSASIEDPKMVA